MTSSEAVQNSTATEADSADNNVMPKSNDAASLPVIPTELPQAVQEYASSSARGRVQVKRARAFLDELNEYGQVILSQHHAEGAAEQELENSDTYADKREELDSLADKAEQYLNAYNDLMADVEAQRAKIIADIVASKSSDVNYEEAFEEYRTTFAALNGNVKTYQAAGEQVYSAFKDFVKSVPSPESLVEGKRKGARSNSTMPGSGSQPSWKPTFAWLEIKQPSDADFKRLDGVNSIGALCKSVYGSMTNYESIIANLTSATGGKGHIKDGEVYEWTRSVQNEDDGTELVTRFRGEALSRAGRNARAEQEVSTATVPAEVTSQPEGNDDAAAIDF